MFYEKEYIELKSTSMINVIVLYLIGLFWVKSYTVFCYNYFSFKIIHLDSIITQLSCIIIFLILLHHNRLISYYLRDMLDPHFSFNKEVYHKLVNKNKFLIILVPLTLVYGTITQHETILRLLQS